MKRVLFVSSFLIVFICSCEKEDPDPSVSPPGISVTCNQNKNETFGVGQELIFSIAMTSDVNVGIARFTISKSGSELFSRSDYTTNLVNFEFGYTTIAEDVDAGDVVFKFELTDNNGTVASEEVTVMVAVDLPVTIQELAPNPGWNLVDDIAVDTTANENVDILQFSVQVDQFSTEVYWTSLNGGTFYDVSDQSINFFDINLSYGVLQSAIVGVTPQDTIQIALQGPSSIPLPVPMIVEIRNGQELMLIDYSTVQASMVGYRKQL